MTANETTLYKRPNDTGINVRHSLMSKILYRVISYKKKTNVKPFEGKI